MRERILKSSLDFYAILGVQKFASAAELRSAYRRQALRTHPDKGGSAEAFRQVLHAFEVLSSTRARAKYDKQRGERGEANAKPRAAFPKRPRKRRAPRTEKVAKFSKMTKSMMRLRKLAARMPPEQRWKALEALSAQLRARLLEFMTTYGKQGVPPSQSQEAQEAQEAQEGESHAAENFTEESSDSEVLALEEEAEVVDVEATHLTDAEDVEDEPEHVATDAKAIANKRRKRSGCTGLKGVSRRIDTKTRNVSYQASVCFDNLTFRSKYCPDVQTAVDYHITLMQIRNE
ncbi:unnamed protein product, partial [Effrenium voratum]